MESDISFSVFTKPWKDLSISQLGKLVMDLGFEGIEFPLRAGFQVEPENAEKGLPMLADQLAQYGVKVYSVAGGTEEHTFAGCAAAGVKMIRIIVNIDPALGYTASVNKAQQMLETLMPLCEKYGVKVGVQQHWNSIPDSAGLMHLVQQFDPAYIGAVWDAAHDALAGRPAESGVDIVWSHLAMVNLKNAYYRRVNGPEAEIAEWERYFTSGPNGLASWPRVIDHLNKRNYRGTVCLTAEYTAGYHVDRLIAQDLAYARELFDKKKASALSQS